MPSVLSVKQLGTEISNFKPKTKLQGFVPKEARTFDFVKGFSEKNGNFEIYSFWDNAKQLIARETVFSDKSKNICKFFSREHKNLTEINTHIYEDEEETETIYEDLRSVGDNRFCSLKEDLKKKDGKIISCRYSNRGLKRGYKPSYINYEYNWDGSAPQISCGRFLVQTSKEEKRKKDMFKSQYIDYLPILNSYRSIENTDNRVKHISKLMERKYNIEGIVKEDVKRVTDEQLGEHASAHCFNTGEIELSEEITNSYNLLDVLGHEYQHCNDFIDMNRYFLSWTNPEILYKNYTDEEKSDSVKLFRIASLKKGVIEANKKEMELFHKLIDEQRNYEYLCQSIGHDNLETEKRAIKAGNEEKDKYIKIYADVFNYLFNIDKTVKAKFIRLFRKLLPKKDI